MDVGGICNKEIVDDTAEDNALFAMYIKVFSKLQVLCGCT